MGTILILILIAIIVLAMIGMGLSNFYSAVLKGVEKIKNSHVVRNITDTATSKISKVVKNVSNHKVDNSTNH